MYSPNFLDRFDRLVAFYAETTGKRTPDAEFVRKQPLPGRLLASSSRSVSSRCCATAKVAARARRGLRGSSGCAYRPRGHQDPPHWPAELKNAPRFPTNLPRVKEFSGELAIVAHAYKNERDFLDYEFARAKAISWGESAYPDERYICTQVLFAELSPAPSKSLTAMSDRLVLDTSERDDRHGALLDADMTADALILIERQLKHGDSGAPRSWTST